MMEICDPHNKLVSAQAHNKIKINDSSKSDPILCEHCKRTASNGIRCLGMCVADNEY